METLNWYCSDCEAHFDHFQSESQEQGSIFLGSRCKRRPSFHLLYKLPQWAAFARFPRRLHCASALSQSFLFVFARFPRRLIVPLPLHRAFSSCFVGEGLESKCIFPATIACISGQEHFSRTRDFTSLIRSELIVLQVQFNHQYSCARDHWDQCRNFLDSEKKTVVWVLMVGYAEGVETRASLEWDKSQTTYSAKHTV